MAVPQRSHLPPAAASEIEPRHRISLIKGEERWLFRWDPGDESLLINCIAQMARDPGVPFDWYDAAVICKHVAQPFGSSAANKNTK
jgi:hypothetical protein